MLQFTQEHGPFMLYCASILIIALLLGHTLIQLVFGEEADLSMMTDAELQFESLYCTEHGEYPNVYSRELERRQSFKVRA